MGVIPSIREWSATDDSLRSEAREKVWTQIYLMENDIFSINP